MRNPFLVIRFVFFSLLVYLSLLILVFASWNVHATSRAGVPIAGAVPLMILNSCAVFFLVASGFAELVYPNLKLSHLKFECIWAMVISLLQLGASIGLTVDAPFTICHQSTEWSICVSSSLLLPTAWISSVAAILYFFTLLATTTAHIRSIPDVWSKTIYTVAWFGMSESKCKQAEKTHELENDSWTRYLENLESSTIRKQKHAVLDIEKAPWAAKTNIKRGVDAPFARRDEKRSSVGSPAATLPPTRPLRVEVKGNQGSGKSIGSRFIERFRESGVTSRSGSRFPSYVEDDSKPIPLPRLSEWIRADAINGINVHIVPPLTP